MLTDLQLGESLTKHEAAHLIHELRQFHANGAEWSRRYGYLTAVKCLRYLGDTSVGWPGPDLDPIR